MKDDLLNKIQNGSTPACNGNCKGCTKSCAALNEHISVSASKVEGENVAYDTGSEEQSAAENLDTVQNSETAEATENNGAPLKKSGKFKDWWQRHKPSKRRLIQVYAALLYNANIRGFIKGSIFTGKTKVMCVPGLNCYSCPGAVGACPLGSLQNALAATKTRAPFYVFGIIMLYGLIFARTVCGFLCPVGLGQELLYKIRTPKLKKNKVTRLLSYFKYVLLAVLVIAIPVIYAKELIPVPGFCKYICPAGTFGGAIALLAHPVNANMFAYLGPLFTWKTIVLIVVIIASIFIYRFFCRFLCPLGALYGFFNKIALLGVKLDKSKCTDCGLCVAHCKMDVKKVGDHECINCGECIKVCPVNAISWKGGKIFINKNEAVALADNSERPLDLLINKSSALNDKADCGTEQNKAATGGEALYSEPPHNKTPDVDNRATTGGAGKMGGNRPFVLKVVSAVLAGVLLVVTAVYANFGFKAKKADAQDNYVTYVIKVSSRTGKKGIVSFKIGDSDDTVVPSDNAGTADDPYKIDSICGKFYTYLQAGDSVVYYNYKTKKSGSYTVSQADDTYNLDDLKLEISLIKNGVEYAVYNYVTDKDKPIEITLQLPSGDGIMRGNNVGEHCYDFALPLYTQDGSVKLSDYIGKIVIINCWGTWCTPCVEELPEFFEVAEDNDDVELIAVHSAGTPVADIQSFITSSSKRWDTHTKIHFVLDRGSQTNKSEIYLLLGGNPGAVSYPYTVIVDKEGIVRYKYSEALSKSKLIESIEACRTPYNG